MKKKIKITKLVLIISVIVSLIIGIGLGVIFFSKTEIINEGGSTCSTEDLSKFDVRYPSFNTDGYEVVFINTPNKKLTYTAEEICGNSNSIQKIERFDIILQDNGRYKVQGFCSAWN